MGSVADFLIIFLKYPKPGSVKTRLAKEIGQKEAVDLYKAFVDTVLKRTKGTDFKRLVFYDPVVEEEKVKTWLGNDISIYPQKGKDLGQRLANAFLFAFQKGASNVVVIGTDSPLVNKETISEAFRELRKNDCVIAPSTDGGYCLLGLSSFYAELFQDIDWSTEKVFSQSIDAIRKSNLKYALLDMHFDIDDKNGLILLKQALQDAQGADSADLKFLLDKMIL